MSLSPPRREDQAGWEAGCGGAIPNLPSGGQTKSGASRSGRVEGLVVGEHVPDRGAQPTGDAGLSDVGAALAAEPALGVLIAVAVGRVSEGVHRGFEHRPARLL